MKGYVFYLTDTVSFIESLGLNQYAFQGIDPYTFENYKEESYSYFKNNNMADSVPLDGEYLVYHDENGKEIKKKVSDLGDEDGLDFNHLLDGDNKGDTQIINTNNGYTNMIRNGANYIFGYFMRDDTVDWLTIFEEWKSDHNGPENSLMYGRNNTMNKQIRQSNLYHEIRNEYLDDQKKDKNLKKDRKTISFANYLPAFRSFLLSGNNMTLQMMGTTNVSFYDIGNYQRLVVIMDSKSVESFDRLGPLIFGKNFSYFLTKKPQRVTRQTYMWIDNNVEE